MSAKQKFNKGDRFFFWTLVEDRGMSRWRAQQWLCRCDCGTERVMPISRLKAGRSRSCGKCSLAKPANQKQIGAQTGKLDGKPTTAICPKCGREHIVVIPWTGRGVPRKYCDKCRTVAGGVGDYALHFNAGARGAAI